MKRISVKIGNEGNILLPKEIVNELGKKVTIKKTKQGYLLTSRQLNNLNEFRKIINSKPHRTGKPTFASTQDMKSIWEKTIN
jgi:hypothetical protein